MRGIAELEVGGKVRHFHFGTYMFMLCENEGIKASDLAHSDKPVNAVIAIMDNAARAYCDLHKEKPDFSRVDVASWVDELGMERITELIQSSLNPKEKNPAALESQG